MDSKDVIFSEQITTFFLENNHENLFRNALSFGARKHPITCHYHSIYVMIMWLSDSEWKYLTTSLFHTWYLFYVCTFIEIEEISHLIFSTQYLNDVDGLVQETRNSIANALELHLSCTYPFDMLLFLSHIASGSHYGDINMTVLGHKTTHIDSG